MNILTTNYLFTLMLLILFNSCSKGLVHNSVKTESECNKVNGYWYNNKCWNDFNDDGGIPKEEIDAFVENEMKILEKSEFKIDDKAEPQVAFMPTEEEGKILLISVYGTKNRYKTLVYLTEKKEINNEKFECPILLFNGNMIASEVNEDPVGTGKAIVNVIDVDNIEAEITGEITDMDGNNSQDFSLKTNESVTGRGNSHFEIKGKEAYLSGYLGTITYFQLKELMKNHPDIKTIVMTHISGSVNDAVNIHTGRLLRENNFTTKVLSNSEIASGGVDLFCAGKKRIVEKGAKIGIHSWCCVNDLTAIELPKDHPAHQHQIKFFTMALGKELGPAFYFRTLEAAPFDGIHFMSDDEIKKWTVATEFIDK